MAKLIKISGTHAVFCNLIFKTDATITQIINIQMLNPVQNTIKIVSNIFNFIILIISMVLLIILTETGFVFLKIILGLKRSYLHLKIAL